jgi:type 1 glutamine amidotransferase
MFQKKKLFTVALFVTLAAFSFAKPPKILVFSKTTSYYHEAIPNGVAAIQLLGKQYHFDVDTTKDAGMFTEDNLKQYAAVVFVNTADESSTLLNEAQQTALMHFIEAGKGFVGIHAAADAEYKWPWYNKLVGAYFKSHPKQQEADVHVTDSSFTATKGLPSVWKHFDEWYNYKQTNWDDVHVVLTVDEKSYTGGENGDYHPVCWYHNYDGGRAFYLGLGHTKECYTDPVFLKLLAGGIQYAMNKPKH